MLFLPVKMQRKLVERSKYSLVLSNRIRPLKYAGVRVYDLMRFVIQKRFASVPGVRSVYLCHSLVAGECYPGLSDFDIAIVFDSPDPFPFYERIREKWGSLKRYFPIADLSIITVKEFNEWQIIGGGWDPLEEVYHWRLLAGEELRREKFHSTADTKAMDRMQWALGHFQNLLHIAIKEEQQSPFMAIIARRQLHKYFWHIVLALESKYLAVAMHRERIAMWIQENGIPEPVAALQMMYEKQFMSGPITTTRFTAAAHAYQLLDKSLEANPLLGRSLYKPKPLGKLIPITNHEEVEERARTMCISILEMLQEKISSIILSSTGTIRGYALYIVLCDGLSVYEIADVFRDIRAIHRILDDPWFNEHFPAGIPIVCSRMMFLARLQTGRSSLNYFENFSKVLFGPDLYIEATLPSDGEVSVEETASRQKDWCREHLLYSIHLHQVYLGRYKPALHDYVTFYFPRLMIQRHTDSVPATAEEAVTRYAGLVGGDQGEIPRRMLNLYHGKDLDHLLRTMDLESFTDVWPLLRQGLYFGTDS